MGYIIDTVWPSTMMGFVKNYLIKFKEEITVIDFPLERFKNGNEILLNYFRSRINHIQMVMG